MVARVNRLLDDVNRRGLPAKAVAALDGTNRLVASLQAKLDQLPVAELSREAAATMARPGEVLARLDGEEGLLASVQRTSDSLGDLAGPRLRAGLDEPRRATCARRPWRCGSSPRRSSATRTCCSRERRR